MFHTLTGRKSYKRHLVLRTVFKYLFKSGGVNFGSQDGSWISQISVFGIPRFPVISLIFVISQHFCGFRRISRIFMFSVKIQLPPPPAPEPFINVTISWCFRGAPFCETNIFVKIAVFGEIWWFSWKSVNFTENHAFHENDDFAGNGTPETAIIL